jgi:hypothetical protein
MAKMCPPKWTITGYDSITNLIQLTRSPVGQSNSRVHFETRFSDNLPIEKLKLEE